MAYREWSEIPKDILISITERVHSVADYLSAIQVCKTWRTSHNDHLSIPQPPFLLLPQPPPNMDTMEEDGEDDEDEDTDESELEYEDEEEEEEESIPGRGIGGVNCTSGNGVCELHLPELNRYQFVGSTGNWLILVSKDHQIQVFNPFTRAQFQLPPQSTIPEFSSFAFRYNPEPFLKKVVLSSAPKFPTTDLDGIIAVAIYTNTYKLAICKPGDRSWIPIIGEDHVHDAIFFKDRLYFVNCNGLIGFYHTFHNLTDPIIATQLSGEYKFRKFRMYYRHYLVECLGELLLVRKIMICKKLFAHRGIDDFRVYKFDFGNAEWEGVENLGQHSLFVGFNTSVSVLASPDSSSSFKRNCIYYTDSQGSMLLKHGNGVAPDIGVYSLEDRTFKSHYAQTSAAFLKSPPLWIVPRCLSEA